MTGEELLLAFDAQYRAIVQMNRLLLEMVEEARDQGLMRELYSAVNKADAELGVGGLDRPAPII